VLDEDLIATTMLSMYLHTSVHSIPIAGIVI
jgi:hypothetical protein